MYPPAYFITFTTYGTRLHNDERGSVDRAHNRYGDALLPADAELNHRHRQRLKQHPYLLDAPRRAVVLNAICQHARFRSWDLYAAHVRTNHVHAVVAAAQKPERVLDEFKAYASRALNRRGHDEPDRLRWTRHGSTRHLFTEQAVLEAVHYAVFEQGTILSMFVAPTNSDARATTAREWTPTTG